MMDHRLCVRTLAANEYLSCTSMTLEQALDHFYRQHGYGPQGGITKKWALIKMGPLRFFLPNFNARRKHIYLHDINHLVSGYDVSWVGESSLASWQIASGGWGRFYFLWLISLQAMAIGVMLYGRQSYQAFQAGLGMKNAWSGGLSKPHMYQMSVAALRLRLQRSSSERVNRRYWVWAGLSLLVYWAPILIGLGLLWRCR